MFRRRGVAQPVDGVPTRSFPYFAILYVLVFGAFGTEILFVPSLLDARGLAPSQIAIVLAAGTIAQVSAGPIVGIIADRFGTRRVLGAATLASGAIILFYLTAAGFWRLMLVSIALAVATAGLNPLADALALNASDREGRFDYGWVRGLGSTGFIVGMLASGALVARFGIDSIVVIAAGLFVLVVLPIPRLPPSAPASPHFAGENIRAGVLALLDLSSFRRLLLVAGLVMGSHAMSDSFAVLHWRSAGISPTVIVLLTSVATLSEIVVFIALGPILLRKLGTARCASLAAGAGVARWAALAESDNVYVLASTSLLHGLTFALMHLACMQIIAAVVPVRLFATAQTLYGTFCIGVASAAITLATGALYGHLRAHAFWLGSGLCLAALPSALRLKAQRRAPV